MLESQKKKDEEEQFPENLGPGYIGCNTNNKQDDVIDDMMFKDQLYVLKEGFASMKKEFEELKLDINKKEKKEIAKMKSELNDLKEDYSKFMEDMKKETHARNEAETLVKVLKDTLEAKAKLEGSKQSEQMDVDKESGGKKKVVKDTNEAKTSSDTKEVIEDMDIGGKDEEFESDGEEGANIIFLVTK